MKKLLLVTTLFIIALSVNAQTFTYTGTGNWTDQANWAPSYPGDNGLQNSSYIINIDGDCEFSDNTVVLAQLNISGVLSFTTNNTIDYYTDVFLNNGVFRSDGGLNLDDNTLSGSGTITSGSGFLLLFSAIINPGDTGSGTFLIPNAIDVVIADSEFIFDIYNTSDFDTIINASSLNNSNNNTLTFNLANTNTVNHNDTFALFVNTKPSLFNGITFNTNSTNGFQPQFSFVENGIDTSGDIVLTLLDIEAPTITNCPSNQNVTADCGIYYEIPDYTTTSTATDNAASAITFTQSLPAGVAVKDGTVITITATDAAGNSSDCSFTLNVTEDTLSTTQAGDVVSKNISLFPNPSKGVFTLKNTSGLLLETGQVIDAKGALIKTIDLSSYSPNKTIDLGSLSAGIYVFKIITVDGFVTKKISIE